MQRLPAGVELKSGKKIEASLVVVGVGAKPNTEMFKGQLDLLEDKPGGVKVSPLLLTSSLACIFSCCSSPKASVCCHDDLM